MHQRHKHLLVALREFPHRFLHHGVAAGEASFLEPLPYPLGRVPLLARQQLVLLEDLFDALLIRPQLGLRPGLAQPLAWRLTVRQDLFEREPVHPGLPENFRLIVSVSIWLVGCFRKPANMGTFSWSSDTGKNEDCRQLAGLVKRKS